jgi:hypothetical protein
MNFQHSVFIPVDVLSALTYTHPFRTPQMPPNAPPRWSTKPLPPKRVTNFLRASGFRRFQDYMVVPDVARHGFHYRFIDAKGAMLLSLFQKVEHTSTTQTQITCPHCQTTFQPFV